MNEQDKTLSNAMINKYLERNKELVTEYGSVQSLVDAINVRIPNDTTINTYDKSILTNTLNIMSQKIKFLICKSHIYI
ncbi:hypothetical protein DK2RH_02690 [Rickettsia helvetica]|uniref:hypothetical protein n=1 Tax=Rickettsia helvetica TaxID=35789 RepID=UPI0033A6EF1F